MTDDDPRRGAPPAIIGPYLATIFQAPLWAECEVQLISGGKSNLTYRVSSLAGEVVLRRPPLAAVLPTAHDMAREYRVLSALADTDVPVPLVHHLCTDSEVIGAPFYVMDCVDGVIIREAMPEGYAETAAERSAIADALVHTLVAIHRVPTTGALEGYGRPDGYLARQIRRWTGQWEATKGAVDPGILGELDRLAEGLSAKLPEQRETTLVHGDFRLDNTMLDRNDPSSVIAVLDWELSTLGDPLADVGLLGVYWGSPNSPVGGASLTSRVTLEPGFPSREEVFERYAAASGRDLGDLPWYVAFGYFKLAVIATGVAARHQAGGMIGEGFDTAAAVVGTLVNSGLTTLQSGRLD